MRRRAPAAQIPSADRHFARDWTPSKERRGSDIKRRRVGSLPKQVVGHPLFGFLLFLILFPGWALVSHLRKLCAEGVLSGCGHNNPSPFLARSSPKGSSQEFLPNWRPDRRCGSNFPAPSGHLSSVCNPFARDHCCSHWGYCGNGPDYCAQALQPPFNKSGTAFQKFRADFQQRRSGEPNTFQFAYDEAYIPITNNYTKLIAALEEGQSLTSDQQAIIQSAVTTMHKQLEQFACCTSAPPFLISASGHWTQDSRLTAEYLKQLVSTYVYDPDHQPDKPFWQRIFGLRKLLGSTPSSLSKHHMGKGRLWSSQAVSPDPGTPHPAQRGTAGRPALKRQNAFKLNEEQSQALTQQLGIGSHVHSGSGHDLLAEATEEAHKPLLTDQGSEQLASTASASLNGILAGAKALSQGALFGELSGPEQPNAPVPDLHQPFNATTAYANITRCNPKRWAALHTSGTGQKIASPYMSLNTKPCGTGTNFSQPRVTASGKTLQPPPRVTSGPVENQGFKSIPLTSFQGRAADSEGQARVLVVYHYYESLTTCEEDEEIQLIRDNLLSFLRFAVRENDGAHYVISLGGRINSSLLDLIPAYCNVRLRFVDNSTMHSDTCSFQRALLDFGPALLQRYEYYVVINNGMRGPFARAAQGHEQQHWSQPFIDKLDQHVKLVGPYLSCEIEIHLQGPFLVTDRVGVRHILDIWGGCWGDHQTDIENGEVGLTQALLADGYNVASLQHEYAGLDWRRQPDRLQCKGRLPGSNPTFCCDVPDPLQLHWVKYGGLAYRLGLIPPTLFRIMDDMTRRTMEVTPPLIPNGSHWRPPSTDWVQQQQQAVKERSKSPSLLRNMLSAPARLLGIIDDSLQGSESQAADPSWTLVERVAAMLRSVPESTQRTANSFLCSEKDSDPGLMGWLADAATKLSSEPIKIQAVASVAAGGHAADRQHP